ncbi:MAG TPA: hypothetical protein VIJ43_03810 [Burkholderiales bacterium]
MTRIGKSTGVDYQSPRSPVESLCVLMKRAVEQIGAQLGRVETRLPRASSPVAP